MARSSLKRGVGELLRVEEGEWRLVALCFLFSFFIGFPRIFTIAAANSLFLESFSAQWLPAIYVASAVLVPIVGAIYIAVSRRAGLIKTRLAVLLCLALSHLTVWLALTFLDGPVVRVVAILLVDTEWVMGLVVFWGLANQLFTVRQSKRVFGLVGSGEIIATILLGLLMPLISSLAGTAALLLFSCAGELLALIVLWKLNPQEAEDDGGSQGESGVQTSLTGFVKDSYIRYPLFFVGLAYAIYYFADAAFYQALESRLTAAEISGVVGQVYAFIGIGTMVGRTIIAPRWLARFGLRGALLTAPIGIIIAASLILSASFFKVAPWLLFWLIIGTKFFERFLLVSIGRPTYNILFQPLPAAERSAAQAAAESQVGQIAGGIAGVAILILLKGLGFGLISMACGLLILGFIWCFIGHKGALAYPLKLRESLRERGLQGVELPLEEAGTLQLLEEQLENDNPNIVINALELLCEANPPGLSERLMALIDHPNPAIAKAGFDAIRGSASGELDAVIDRLGQLQDEGVLGAAIRAVGALGGVEVLGVIQEYLEDERLQVKGAALVAMVRDCGIPGAVRGGARVLELEHSARASDRLLAARVIGDIEVTNFYTELLPLLDDEDLDVQMAAIEAAGRLKAQGTWGHVIGSLEVQKLRHTAVRALLACGDPVLYALQSSTRTANPTLAMHIVRVAGLLRSSRAIRFLADQLRSTAGPDDQPVLQALRMCRYSATEQQAMINGRLHNEIKHAAVILQSLQDLANERSTAELCLAFNIEFERTRERIFYLLSFLFNGDDIMNIWSNWQEGSARRQAFAIELLSNLLPQQLATTIFPLLDAIPAATRLERLGRFSPQQGMPYKQRLEALLHDPSLALLSWTRGCLLAAAFEASIAGSGEEVRDQVASHEPLIARRCRELVDPDQSPGYQYGLGKRVAALSKVDVFSRVAVDKLAEVALELEEVTLEKGQVLFDKGVEGTSMYVVIEGRVAILDGDVELTQLGPDQILGELAAFDPEPRSASVMAIEATRCFAISQHNLSILVGDHLEVAFGIFQVLCQRIRGQLDNEALPCRTTTAKRPQEAWLSFVEKVLFLKSAELFRETPGAVLLEIATLTKVVQIAADTVLFERGELKATLYIIVKGKIRIHHEQSTIAILEQEAVLGEMAALSNAPRSASATAVEDSLLLSLNQDSLREIMYSQPEVTQALLATLAKRLRNMNIKNARGQDS
jgi:CRP-like cAMP-binding protein/HEAT repeat protein